MIRTYPGTYVRDAIFFIFFVNVMFKITSTFQPFYELVGGFTLNVILDTPSSQVSSLLPPRYVCAFSFRRA